VIEVSAPVCVVDLFAGVAVDGVGVLFDRHCHGLIVSRSHLVHGGGHCVHHHTMHLPRRLVVGMSHKERGRRAPGHPVGYYGGQDWQRPRKGLLKIGHRLRVASLFVARAMNKVVVHIYVAELRHSAT
jgi:hypothetical protein